VKACLLLFFLLIGTVVLAQQAYTVETVPNVKLVNNSYVSNPDNILSSETVAAIDSLLISLEDSATAQVAIVALNSIGEYDPFLFAQELFERWKIGQKGKDNGLLILLVKDQRTVHFHTGYGVEGILPDATCKKIQTDHMAPYFKDGNYDQGMLEGVKATAAILSHPDDDTAGTVAGDSEQDLDVMEFAIFVSFLWIVVAFIVFIVKLARKSFRKNENAPDVKSSPFGWFLTFIVLPVFLMIAFALAEHFGVFFAGIYGYLAITSLRKRGMIDREAEKWLEKKDYQGVYDFYKERQTLFSVLRFLMPIPFAFTYGAYKKKLEYARNHPRNCNQCGMPLTKLDENKDDDFLSKSELLEETLKSVDYDVWKCTSCNAAEKFSYINEKSKYEACPKCGTIAYYEVSDRTIRSATKYSDGEGEQRHACKDCGHQNVRRYSIARIQESSDSSGSSSSSSGGSWGGGRSGGGGASTSW
jgi:uncharacterized protein